MAITVFYKPYSGWVVINIGRSTIQCKVEDLPEGIRKYVGLSGRITSTKEV